MVLFINDFLSRIFGLNATSSIVFNENTQVSVDTFTIKS